MNRRHFLKNSSLGFSGVLLSGALLDAISAPIPKMKITKVRFYESPLSRPMVNQSMHIVVVETDAGLTGIGEGGYVDGIRECAEMVIGEDPTRIDHCWQLMFRGRFYPAGREKLHAIGAIDMALWDIKAKMAGMPLYQLLGGRSRDGIMVYGHANGSDIAETVEAVGNYIDMGYKAIRAQTGVPGIKDAYGVGRGKLYYEPADASLPSVTGWDTRKALNYVPKLFEELRKTYGFDHHLLHDGHHRYTPQEAANLGKMLEPYQLFWLEDCTPAENQEAFKIVRQHTVTPLAVGEIFNTIWDAKDLIQNQLIDYIRATVVGAGGITHLRRIADLASLYQVRTGCHGATDLSPVTMGCALHFDTWVPNFGIQEYMRHTDETDAVFPHDYTFEKGELFVGDTPGHGVDIDEKLAAKYPYKPAYLPVARLEDGTMWSW